MPSKAELERRLEESERARGDDFTSGLKVALGLSIAAFALWYLFRSDSGDSQGYSPALTQNVTMGGTSESGFSDGLGSFSSIPGVSDALSGLGSSGFSL